MFRREARIDTPNLSLIPLALKDAHDLQRITNHHLILDAISLLPANFTLEDAKTLISRSNERDCYLGIREKQADALVGLFRVHGDGKHSIEVGYWIDVNRHGRGYASEALSHTVARLRNDFPNFDVIAHCAPDNEISRHLLMKHGFRLSPEISRIPGKERFVLA